MSNLCIIPARGGSKRIPRKNIKDFLGKPIIAYSIEVAIESGLFDEIMVSTDDHEIAETALKYGAKVPFMRSKENSTDFSTTADVIDEVIDEYKKNGSIYSYCCCIYPTAPLISSINLKQAYNTLVNSGLDSIFPIVQFSYPIQRALKLANNKVQFVNPENKLKRSQDLEVCYHDAGQWYWFSYLSFLNNKSLLTNNTGSIILDELNVQDIDNETDWKIAEIKYKTIYQI